jgi:hypothetical protein
MKTFEIKCESKTDNSSTERPPLYIKESPRLSGPLEIWGWSMNQWELHVWHNEPSEKTRTAKATKNLPDKTWTVLDAEDDTQIEYSWWFDNYKPMLQELVALGALVPDNSIRLFPGSTGYRLVREGKESIPIRYTEIQGLSNARWAYATAIEDLANMESPPTKEEWVEAILGIHNEIVESLQTEWNRVKTLY